MNGHSKPSDSRKCNLPPRESLPQVEIPGNGVTLSESACSLSKALAATGKYYFRNGLVEISDTDQGPVINSISPSNAVSELEQVVNFVRRKKAKQGEWDLLPTNITSQLFRQYLASRHLREALPKIEGLLNAPLLLKTSNGVHVVDSGYDPHTGFYVLQSKLVPKMSLKEAIQRIKFIIEDYDFTTAGDRSRAIASIITPAMRFGGFISGHIPVDVAEADESQAGKTYRQTLVAAVYNEEVRAISQHTGGVGSLDEAFNERLVEGHPFIQFDNLRGNLNSTRLESFLTATGSFAARVPNRGSVSVNPSKYIVFISSNDFKSTFDLANRSSLIAIRKRHGAEFKRFEDGRDLREHIKVHFNEYLGAVYTIIQHWHSKGSPRTDERQHAFRDWCQKSDWIVQNIFKEAPLMEGHRERQFRIAYA